MDFISFLKENIVVFDGAMGTSLQKCVDLDFGSQEYDGCNEALNLFSPDIITDIHSRYFNAGANVVETNTFGANEIVLAEYGLEDKTEEINRRAVKLARDAVKGEFCWVAGSIGPSTKMPTLGHISFDNMFESYLPQVRGLVAGGVDILLIETCQDPFQAKIVLMVIEKVVRSLSVKKPVVMVSLTLENSGTMLAGSDIGAALSILAPFNPDIIGLNCAAGPRDMAPNVAMLAESFSGFVSAMPNAGMPVMREGKTVYPAEPEEFADDVVSFVEEYNINIVGGCCGTTPEHIAAVKEKLKAVKKQPRVVKQRPKRVSSLYSAVDLKQTPPPLLAGERANATGSKRFRELLLADDFESMVAVAVDQEREGAHLIDISVSYAGRNEVEDMISFCRLARTRLKLPLMIDSTNPEVVENALKIIPGRSVINSVNLEDGGEKLRKICSLARDFGVPVVALVIDEKGMAIDFEHKIEAFKRIRDMLAHDFGLFDGDVLFDMLTFTVGSGEECYRYSAKHTLDALSYIEENYPDVLTILGVSNISYGLDRKIRPYLNTVFTHMAVERGLDAAIAHSGKVVPYHMIPESIRDACEKLLEGTFSVTDFLGCLGNDVVSVSKDDNTLDKTPEELIRIKIITGDKRDIEAVLTSLLETTKPSDIISDHLLAAMQEVGELFGSGKMQLPFVLQAAEVMKFCIGFLETKMNRDENSSRGVLLLGTVAGDVHDIGKNLVKIIFSNNGYDVIDLGVKVGIQSFIDGIKEHNPDAVGMSGLLVQSVQHMLKNLQTMRSEGIKVPVFLGGAALTRRFVEDECQQQYNGPVTYCRHAFDALKALDSGCVKSDALPSSRVPSERKVMEIKPAGVPEVSAYGHCDFDDFDFDSVEQLINKEVLYKTLWGFLRGKKSEEEYRKQYDEVIEPAYKRIKQLFLDHGCYNPKGRFGYYRCYAKGETLHLFDENGNDLTKFNFPRQPGEHGLCITDFFQNENDVIGLALVTLGPKIIDVLQQMYSEDSYSDYYLLYGFAAEITEALMAKIHRDALKLGKRFSFGYSCCPDLVDNGKIIELMAGNEFGVSLTDDFQMIPEFSVAAFNVHHPQVCYFSG